MAILHREFLPDASAVVPRSIMDARVGRVIQQTSTEDFREVLQQYDDWDFYYHLSEVRRGLLNWYPFPAGCRVLEIGAGFGALTGLLCDRCGTVVATERDPYRAISLANRYSRRENLEVFPWDPTGGVALPEQEPFDYIILNGVLEWVGNGDPNEHVYADFLRRLQETLLAPEGRFLIAAENRLGLRYFCGEHDSFTGRPFDSINNYPFGSAGRGFSKKELADILALAGLENTRFFYPLPDHRLPQLIYSDAYLGGSSIGERLSTYSVRHDSLVAWERRLYKDIQENGALDVFANAFLVECSATAPCCDIEFAVLSTDRGPEHGLATTVHADGFVRKTALYPQGVAGLHRAYEAISLLASRGVPVVSHTLEENDLLMPRMELPVLTAYLQQCLQTHPQQVLDLMDLLYHDILASSDLAAPEENEFYPLAPDKDFGPILKVAFIDMVPANCFYDEGVLRFFDQEYMRPNIPARFIIFRAIKYIYATIETLPRYFSIEEFKHRFWLEDLWETFEYVESCFANENRQLNLCTAYTRCVTPDLNAIYHRGELLSYRGEPLTQDRARPKTRSVQQIQLQLLAFLQDVCREHDLHFYLVYGSLLGAVRHGGFVPWDDDIDVAMPRADYDRLVALSASFPAPFFLQTMENDPGCFYGGYSKLRDDATTALELLNWGQDCHQGIWIDIFPLDNAYADDRQNLALRQEQTRLQRLLYAKTYGNSGRPGDLNPLEWKLLAGESRQFSREELCRMLHQSFTGCSLTDSDVLAIFAQYNPTLRYRVLYRNELQASTLMDFESLRLPVPGEYQRILTAEYGPHYLRYPGLDKRTTHHVTYFRADVPYRDFLARLDLFSGLEGCDLVLYGDIARMEQYLDAYGQQHPPAFLICDDAERWGTTCRDLPVNRPEAIGEPGPCPHRVLICADDFEPLEQNLLRMGCRNFRYFLPNPRVLWNNNLS